MFTLSKREKEENKQLRKRNMRLLSEVLDSMVNVTYKTEWVQAQQYLLDYPAFHEDPDLMSKSINLYSCFQTPEKLQKIISRLKWLSRFLAVLDGLLLTVCFSVRLVAWAVTAWSVGDINRISMQAHSIQTISLGWHGQVHSFA